VGAHRPGRRPPVGPGSLTLPVGGDQGQLFGDEPPAGTRRNGPNSRRKRTGATVPTHTGAFAVDGDIDGVVVRVVPDVRNLRQEFDYLVPVALGDVAVGAMVDIELGNRRERGWVVEIGVTPQPDTKLRPIRRIRSAGPDPSVVALTAWGAWRFAGARSALLSSASAPVRVTTPMPAGPPAAAIDPAVARQAGEALSVVLGMDAASVFTDRVSVIRLPPLQSANPIVAAAAGLGPTLVVTPTVAGVDSTIASLAAAGHRVVPIPGGWAAARAGNVTVVGTRLAVWGPCGPLAAVVVIDEHDEAHAQQHIPTWHSRTVAIERARHAGVPCILVSPTPSLEALAALEPPEPLGTVGAAGALHHPPAAAERRGWPSVEVVDQRYADPLLSGLLSERLAEIVRADGSVLCVLNRRGRSRMLACGGCNEVVRCEPCGSVVAQDTDGELVCGACGARRPPVCAACGRTSLRNVRRGVSRLRDDLEALAGEPVDEVTGDGRQPVPRRRLVVGTSAALHQRRRYDNVVLCDFDQEVLAPRYRAAEEALALLVAAARCVTAPQGAGSSGSDGTGGGLGRIVVQTSVPDHPAIIAAATGDPGSFAAAELARRQELRWPPTTAVALVSGEAAEAFMAGLPPNESIEHLGPLDGQWVVRAPDTTSLCDHLAAAPRPPGRLRIDVDPLRF